MRIFISSGLCILILLAGGCARQKDPQGQNRASMHFSAYEEKGERLSEEWIEHTRKAAPGDDWREIEAQSLRALLEANVNTNVSLPGTWKERGPSNIPGRITTMDIDYSLGHVYAQSDHGIVWKSSDLACTEWTALNDQFPLGLGVASQLIIFPEDQDLVSCGYIKVNNTWGVYYSVDDGLSWEPSSGIGDYIITGIRRMHRSDTSVYLFLQEYNPAIPTDYYTVYRSIDHGQNFSVLYRSAIPVGDGGRHIRSDLWISRDTTSQLYLILEDSLFLVNTQTGFRTYGGLISSTLPNQALLTGLIVNGMTSLTAYEAHGDIGKFYSWNSTEQAWHYKGQLTDWWLSLPFGSNSFTCSAVSADTLYFGGLLTSRSIDGGQTWTTIDLEPGGAYALYHGDVPLLRSFFNLNTNTEEMYMGTDGGLYLLDQAEIHFNSLAIPGLNCTQIYKMISRQSESWKMGIGTQDNGYSYHTTGSTLSAPAAFTFLYGGDVTNVASGDGGNTFWLWWLGDGCNYMSGFTGSDFVSNWSPYWEDGSVPYWEPPVWIPVHHPDQCFTAGYINNTGGNHLIRLRAVSGNAATSTQFSYDFLAQAGGKISAIAISPLDTMQYYVATENGIFLHSSDAGSTWSPTLLASSMYPRVILPSSKNPGEVWVGGSGYSNSPVYHSTNHGASFSATTTGLPSCQVEALATGPDEVALYAATSIGPFALDISLGTWSSIAGNNAPLVQYMDAEYLIFDHVVRFATYARGVWDYRLNCDDFGPIMNIWMGPQNASWYASALNWSLGHFPARCEDVLIPSNALVNLEPGGGVEIRSLTIATGGMLHVLPGADIDILVEN